MECPRLRHRSDTHPGNSAEVPDTQTLAMRRTNPGARAGLGAGVLLTGLLLSGALAGPGARAAQTRWNASQQRALPELRTLELNKLAKLQQLNRNTEQCVRRASTLEALHDCRHQERQAQRQLRQQTWQALASIRQRYGLPEPERRRERRRYDRDGAPPAAEASPMRP